MKQVIVAKEKNEEDIKLFKEYEQEHGRKDGISKLLQQPKDAEDLLSLNKILFIKNNNKISCYAHIYAETDRKLCTMYIEGDASKQELEDLLTYSEDYAFNVLKMEDIAFLTSNNQLIIKKELQKRNFECLGDSLDDEMYIKSKEDRMKGDRIDNRIK